MTLKYFNTVNSEAWVAPICSVFAGLVGFLQLSLGLWLLFTEKRRDRRNVAVALAGTMLYDVVLHLPVKSNDETYTNDVMQFLATVGIIGGLLMVAGLREHKL